MIVYLSKVIAAATIGTAINAAAILVSNKSIFPCVSTLPLSIPISRRHFIYKTRFYLKNVMHHLSYNKFLIAAAIHAAISLTSKPKLRR